MSNIRRLPPKAPDRAVVNEIADAIQNAIQDIEHRHIIADLQAGRGGAKRLWRQEVVAALNEVIARFR